MEHQAKPGTMTVNKHGKASLTDYEVLETAGPYSLVHFRLHTGRTHQIRVHMQALGHPIACDDLYGDGRPILLSTIKRHFKLSKAEEQERPLLARLALHSQLLHFQDAQGEFHTLEAPLPKAHARPLAAVKEVEGIIHHTPRKKLISVNHPSRTMNQPPPSGN